MEAMMYRELVPPTKWRAGFVGEGPDAKPFYFDCADCGAKEPEIAGVLSTGNTYESVAVLPDGSLFKLAMFCKPCFEKRVSQCNPSPIPPAP